MEQKIMLAAHRGYSAAYPENTMLAFREALKLDIDMIETDVHMTSDGVLVLMHDHVMERTTDMKGPIVNYTRVSRARKCRSSPNFLTFSKTARISNSTSNLRTTRKNWARMLTNVPTRSWRSSKSTVCSIAV